MYSLCGELCNFQFNCFCLFLILLRILYRYFDEPIVEVLFLEVIAVSFIPVKSKVNSKNQPSPFFVIFLGGEACRNTTIWRDDELTHTLRTTASLEQT